MTIKIFAALAALTTFVSPAAYAGQPAPAPAAAREAKFSIETTPIGQILADEKAKAVLEKHLPELKAYYDQLQLPTLVQVAPQSNGLITDAKLKALQADFDKLN